MFAVYLLMTILASCLKVSLPNVTGTMSVWFLFVLIGFVELSFGETLVLAGGATLMQTFWHAKDRPRLIQIIFNPTSVAIAILAGFATYHSSIWAHIGIGFPLPLGVAAIVFFVLNTGPVAMAIALTENKSGAKVWRECYFWCLPYYVLGASIAALFSYLARRFGWEILVMALPLVVFMFRSYANYLAKLRAEKVHAEKVAALHLRTIEALALAIEAKDETTRSHLERVKVYALAIGKEMGLREQEMLALEAAALLHDIGKLAVPEHIISKPGKLNAEEFEKIKIHPVVGAEILDRVQFPYPVASIVRAHHEKWDGSGYPYGLNGQDIPIGARILSAVDCLDALSSHRQYRPALPLEEAMKVVAGLSGTAFDPKVVEILERRYVELENNARSHSTGDDIRRLSTGLKIDQGAGPAAGLENGNGKAGVVKLAPVDFLASIAAARQEAQDFFELTKDLGNSLSLDETLWMISARVKKLISYDAICLFLAKDQTVRAALAHGEDSPALSSLCVPFGEGLAGWVAGNRKPVLNGCPLVEVGYGSFAEQPAKLASALAVPLEGLEGVVGVIALYRVAPEAFSRDELRILGAISQKIGTSIENALKFEQVKSSATTDYLTGLPNARSLFVHLDAEVNRCRRSGTPLAVMVCDLDGFKGVNDRFGHLVGNQLLSQLASNLKTACRDYDYLARMGGDEFVFVMPGLGSATAETRMQDLNRLAVEAGEQVCGERAVSLSLGCALLSVDADDAEGLLSAADRRMYRAKRSRKSSQPVAADFVSMDKGSMALTFKIPG